ncbi:MULTISPECIES: hypothetical protein [unclassified Massilia]|uniref:hypothetical protein n=1 Tax=unclassified Massilia TaxID=2609279 RepID=UPI0012E194FA|nr:MULTISPECIES: hypothetical protein [unclassified Massilia]
MAFRTGSAACSVSLRLGATEPIDCALIDRMRATSISAGPILPRPAAWRPSS